MINHKATTMDLTEQQVEQIHVDLIDRKNASRVSELTDFPNLFKPWDLIGLPKEKEWRVQANGPNHWGNFGANPGNTTHTEICFSTFTRVPSTNVVGKHGVPEIIANRNEFGRFLGQQGDKRKPNVQEIKEISLTYGSLDHVEYYKDSDGRCIQVCSQYAVETDHRGLWNMSRGDRPKPDNLHDKLMSEGWVVLKPMYALNATTYARYIDMTAIRAKRDIALALQEIKNMRLGYHTITHRYHGPITHRYNVPSRQIETRQKRIEAFQLKDCEQKQKERATWLDDIARIDSFENTV